MSNTPEPNNTVENEDALRAVSRWLEDTVIGLNLCPFAKREWLRGAVRLTTSESHTEEHLLMTLRSELEHLCATPDLETTLLIHPDVLQDFHDYNAFLNRAEDLLRDMELEGVIQLASFHPSYQFSGTSPADAENYTNRSPYPLLHLLREDSVEHAIAQHPDVDSIPTRNIELMNQLGATALQNRLEETRCAPPSPPSKQQ